MSDHYGRYTQIDLKDQAFMFMPREEEQGICRPPFLRSAARFALELAATSYDFDVDEWLDAGWTDISIQVENDLFSGVGNDSEKSGFRQLIRNEWLPYRARSIAKRRNPVTQVRGALRQFESPDTGKGIVMIRKTENGRYAVAVGFRGTGRRLFDWFPNLDCAPAEGFHRGFLQLTHQFEANAQRIEFPHTAKELGLEKLSLQDIINEAKQPDSRFLLFAAGHSQGGAVMQVWMFRRVREGVLPVNLLGYGFASPTVVWENQGCDFSDFPAWHIINSDDMMPRVGASMHIGRCRVYAAGTVFRTACYRRFWQNDAFRSVMGYLRTIRNTKDALETALGLIRLIETLPENQATALSAGLLKRLLPEKVVKLAGDRVLQAVRHAGRRLEKRYTAVTGRLAADEDIRRLSIRLAVLITRVGTASFTDVFQNSLFTPHNLVRKPGDGPAPYLYMVLRGFYSLQSAMWCGNVPPMWDTRIAAPGKTPVRSVPYDRFHRYSSLRKRG